VAGRDDSSRRSSQRAVARTWEAPVITTVFPLRLKAPSTGWAAVLADCSTFTNLFTSMVGMLSVFGGGGWDGYPETGLCSRGRGWLCELVPGGGWILLGAFGWYIACIRVHLLTGAYGPSTMTSVLDTPKLGIGQMQACVRIRPSSRHCRTVAMALPGQATSVRRCCTGVCDPSHSR
jgi:hypothetical protein